MRVRRVPPRRTWASSGASSPARAAAAALRTRGRRARSTRGAGGKRESESTRARRHESGRAGAPRAAGGATPSSGTAKPPLAPAARPLAPCSCCACSGGCCGALSRRACASTQRRVSTHLTPTQRKVNNAGQPCAQRREARMDAPRRAPSATRPAPRTAPKSSSSPPPSRRHCHAWRGRHDARQRGATRPRGGEERALLLRLLDCCNPACTCQRGGMCARWRVFCAHTASHEPCSLARSNARRVVRGTRSAQQIDEHR